jgi:MFS family permease
VTAATDCEPARIRHRAESSPPSLLRTGTALGSASRPAAAGSPRAGGMFRSLAVRNYRLFASGQVVSLTGTWMQRVAQDWLVLELSESGAVLGLVLALQFGPTLLFSLWGGVLADRYDKRRLLIVTQALMAAQALVLGLLVVGGAVQLWHVCLLAALLGTVSALDVPVRQSFVVEMVGRRDVTNAVGLNSATFNSARIVGPAAAGVMINWVGTGSVFLINAASTIAVIAGLVAMRGDELHRATRLGRAKGQLREGLRYVRGRADLVATMILVFVIGTFGLNFQLTAALMARDVFGRGAGSYGLLSAMLAVGSLVGALLSTRRTARPRQRFLLAAALGFGLLEVGVGLMPSYLAVAIALVPTGAVALSFTIAANSSVQLGVDEMMRGRVMALYLLCFMGGTPFGAPAVGAVSDAFGPRVGLIASGSICALATVGLGLVIARRRGIAVRAQVAEVVALPRARMLVREHAVRRSLGGGRAHRPALRTPRPSGRAAARGRRGVRQDG